jgi:hypothetical protein
MREEGVVRQALAVKLHFSTAVRIARKEEDLGDIVH